MGFIITRRTRKFRGTVAIYRELKMDSNGEFPSTPHDAAIFPTMAEAQFVANGFPLDVGVEYLVSPYQPPEVVE